MDVVAQGNLKTIERDLPRIAREKEQAANATAMLSDGKRIASWVLRSEKNLEAQRSDIQTAKAALSLREHETEKLEKKENVDAPRSARQAMQAYESAVSGLKDFDSNQIQTSWGGSYMRTTAQMNATAPHAQELQRAALVKQVKLAQEALDNAWNNMAKASKDRLQALTRQGLAAQKIVEMGTKLYQASGKVVHRQTQAADMTHKAAKTIADVAESMTAEVMSTDESVTSIKATLHMLQHMTNHQTSQLLAAKASRDSLSRQMAHGASATLWHTRLRPDRMGRTRSGRQPPRRSGGGPGDW